MAEDFLGKLFNRSVQRVESSTKKYGPLVANLNDLDFAALYQVVMAERQRRMVRLMLENPLVRQQAIDEVVKENAEREAEIQERIRQAMAESSKN